MDVGVRTEGAHHCQQIPHLIGQGFRVDHIGRAGVPLVCWEDDLYISAIYCPGQ